MRVIYTPQQSDTTVSYVFDGESVTATIGEKSERFDFSDMPLGRATSISAEILPDCPVVDAVRSDDGLTVTLLNWYSDTSAAPEQREEIV